MSVIIRKGRTRGREERRGGEGAGGTAGDGSSVSVAGRGRDSRRRSGSSERGSFPWSLSSLRHNSLGPAVWFHTILNTLLKRSSLHHKIGKSQLKEQLREWLNDLSPSVLCEIVLREGLWLWEHLIKGRPDQKVIDFFLLQGKKLRTAGAQILHLWVDHCGPYYLCPSRSGKLALEWMCRSVFCLL